MKQYKLYNNVFAWIVWIIASVVYILTIEPTTSFWDCGEFIATAYKLEVGHPPGAPLFMIMARFFSLFASSPSLVALMVNIMSALASSFTILFLFWTITHLAKKIIVKTEEMNTGNMIAIFASGIIGSLAFTFSDTFWFSAVEGEVYASSSLFTAVVFWTILKWEAAADEKYANRWIVLIAYLMGLSVGVHLLNLLAIPAIVFVYYFKKFNTSFKGIVAASLISVILLAVIMYGVIPGAITMASHFERLFVNGLGRPFNWGVLIYVVLLILCVLLGIRFTANENKSSGLAAIFFIGAMTLLGIPLMSKSLLMLVIFAGIVALTILMVKKHKVVLNTILLCSTVILIGYSSFTMIVIRSLANPPMDENNPENVFALLSYLNREQYGDRPLLYGQYFNAPADPYDPIDEGDPVYIKKGDKYVVADHKKSQNYDSKYCTTFPRMFSSQDEHIKDYVKWTGTEERDFFYPILDENGQTVVDEDGNIRFDLNKPKKKPSFADNIKFFFRYQVLHMYGRYFMWNFAGRQNDVQGHGNTLDGNWMCGVGFVDEARLGSQEYIPDNAKNNKARNFLFMIPLILGIIGFFSQMHRHSKDYWIVLLLFFFTGLAIVLYLNQSPHQPRERDYAYAGSFYAFAIWIGLGVLGLYNATKKFEMKSYVWTASVILAALATLYFVGGNNSFSFMLIYLAIAVAVIMSIMGLFGLVVKNNVIRAVFVLIITAFCPIIMANQNWDDHDRSNRYTALHFAANYLNSCAPNAILFTNGDNDTFPLWYAQEVEGIRTDVRVINLSLLNTDWYVDQMKRKAYLSEAVPFSLTKEQYVQGTRDFIRVDDLFKDYTDIDQLMEYVASDNPATKASYSKNELIDVLPSRKIKVPVDSAQVVANGTVKPENASQIVPYLKWDLNKRMLMKSELMVVDLLATNNWERPVYFAITVGTSSYMNLQKYFQLEGLAYRIVPIINNNPNNYNIGRIDTDIMYDNMMNKFQWGGIDDSRVYLDENNMRMTMNFRSNFARLAEELLKEGKRDSALAVLDRCFELMPNELIPYNYFNMSLAEVYYKAGEKEKANKIIEILAASTDQELNYFFAMDPVMIVNNSEEFRRSLTIYNSLSQLTLEYEHDTLNEKVAASWADYYQKYLVIAKLFK